MSAMHSPTSDFESNKIINLINYMNVWFKINESDGKIRVKTWKILSRIFQMKDIVSENEIQNELNIHEFFFS
jgi:hypothetical protein